MPLPHGLLRLAPDGRVLAASPGLAAALGAEGPVVEAADLLRADAAQRLVAAAADGEPELRGLVARSGATVRAALATLCGETLAFVEPDAGGDHFGASPALLLALRPDGRFDSASATFAAALGRDARSLAGLELAELVRPEDRPALSAELEDLALGVPSVRFEAVLRTADGGERCFAFAATRDRASGLVHGVARDVTVEKHVEENLQLTQFSVDNAALGVLWLDRDGRVRYANGEAIRLLDRPAEELLARRFTDLDERLDEAGWETLWSEVATHRTLNARRVLRAADGHTIPVDLSANHVAFRGREVAIVYFRDSTEQLASEQRLREARRVAVQANTAKSAFLAHMSHEVRTPLTSILGFAELLLEPGGTEEQRRGHAETVLRQGSHLLELLNDVLDLSKIEAGRLDVERERCVLPAIVDDVLDLMRVRAEAKGVALVADLRPPFPAEIVTDTTRLRQVLLNLVGNAIKFTDEGEVRVVVHPYDPKEPPDPVRIDVVDTGLGMTAEQQERLFQPFVQAERSTAARFGGTGLGLAISRRLTRLLGGDLSVRSELGRGSVFRVEIDPGAPERVVLRQRVREAEPRAELPADRAPRLRGRVLLADDGADNRRLVGLLLERLGLEVELAADGAEAVEHVERAIAAGAPFDLVLMDLHMPGLDGFEATARLRELGFTAPVVALTARAMAGDREACLAQGFDEYVAKPIQRRRLTAALARFLPSVADGEAA